MTRPASSYRGARRNEWRSYRRLYRGISGSFQTWVEFNSVDHSLAKYRVGTALANRDWPKPGRSKYMPHIGAKQRAKGTAAVTPPAVVPAGTPETTQI